LEAEQAKKGKAFQERDLIFDKFFKFSPTGRLDMTFCYHLAVVLLFKPQDVLLPYSLIDGLVNSFIDGILTSEFHNSTRRQV
jgi:hypothetical protein